MSEFLDTSPLSEYEKRLLLLIWEHGVVTAETVQYMLDNYFDEERREVYTVPAWSCHNYRRVDGEQTGAERRSG